jgi:hypothetical protein
MSVYTVSRPVCYHSIGAHRNEDLGCSLDFFSLFRVFGRPLSAIRIEDAVTSFMMVKVDVAVCRVSAVTGT